MAVTETLKALGSWGLQLKSTVPVELVDKIKYFGHVVVHSGRVDPRVDGDGLLATSRYTGVLRSKKFDGSTHNIGGPGMAMWLGDEDQKGYTIETVVNFNAEPFEDTIRALLPDSVSEGTIYNLAETFTGSFQFFSPRQAIDYVTTTLGADWVVRGDGTLDAGLESDLFVTIPRAALIRRSPGVDVFLKAFTGKISHAEDVEDFSTRILLLASGTEGSVSTGSADIDPGLNPHKDLFGNPVKLTRIISESSTDPSNAEARAQLQLNRFSNPRNALNLSTTEFDIKGDVAVGDYLWVFDPETGLVNTTNEIIFRGERLYPVKLRLTEMTWPVTEGMSVAYRDVNGVWYDLTKYVLWEQGDTTLVVGGYNRSLSGSDANPGTRPPAVDTSIPGVPAWQPDEFIYAVYQSFVDGSTRAQVKLVWDKPDNVDGSAILDGDHYEIRYRTMNGSIFPATHAQMAVKTHAQLALGTQGQPLNFSVESWQTQYVPFDELDAVIQELAPTMLYEAQIRAVDAAKPPNAGAWSTSVNFQTSGDTLPPQTPAAPTIAAGRLNVQITHTLGAATGGQYNLDRDLHHLEIHGDSVSTFSPDEGTLLGKLQANAGMMFARVPLVGSVQIERTTPLWYRVIAVDEAGNKSDPSVAVQSTALLIDNAHISDLSVSKVTAGTITAAWIMAGSIRSGTAGAARTEMNSFGFVAFDQNDQNTFWVDSATGKAFFRGQIMTGPDSGARILINPGSNNNPEIWFYPVAGTATSVLMRTTSYTDPRGAANAGMKIASLNNVGVSNGGELEFGQTGVKMGHYNPVTGQWAYYWIDEQSRHALRGTWNTANFDSFSALVIGSTAQTASGAGGINHSFGMTFASNMRIAATAICDVNGAHPTGPPWSFFCIDQNTQSGFTALWVADALAPPGPYKPGHLDYWAFRI